MNKYQKILHDQDVKFAELLWNTNCLFHSGKEAKVEFSNGEWCSILGGDSNVYGDGVETFDLMTSVHTPEVFGWLSKKDLMKKINDVKNRKGIEDE